MDKSIIIGIDNGCTGTIGIIDNRGAADFVLTPSFKGQDYTKAKKTVSRIDVPRLYDFIKSKTEGRESLSIAYVERPMINPMRFSASINAARAYEATITVLETLCIPYQPIDSKEWQRGLLPSSGKKGVEASVLKQESKDIGIRLFPQFRDLITKHKDADGIPNARSMFVFGEVNR